MVPRWPDLLQLGVQLELNVAFEGIRDRASVLGCFSSIGKRRLVHPWHLASYLELHSGDLESLAGLLDGTGRGRSNPSCRSPSLLQLEGERHAQAGRVRGCNQLFRVGSPRTLEPGRERVVALEGTRSGLEVASAGFQYSFPHRLCFTRWHVLSRLLAWRTSLAR